MPPNRRSAAMPPALSDADVSELRQRVAAGEKPRVVVRAASAAVPAGTRGSVVRVGDPSESEYVVVRLGKDEVPFAPSELGISGRKAVAAKPRPVTAGKSSAKPRGQKPRASAAAAKRAARPAKRVPPMVVTMRFRDGAWTVEAQRGARRIARPQPLRPGAVSAFAKRVDDPAISEALVETVEACRSVVAAKAEELRAELNAAEADLRAYDAK